MLASELMRRLESITEEEGDLPVMVEWKNRDQDVAFLVCDHHRIALCTDWEEGEETGSG